MTNESYLENPCRMSSIPLWKTRVMFLPDSIKIVHDADFDESMLKHYIDEPYFRLKHTLQNLTSFALPDHFSFCSVSAAEYATHINDCYENLHITSNELQMYQKHSVYCPDLWLAVKDDRTGRIAASGIGELDSEIGEGVLEGIQVSGYCRGLGIGSCVVQELLLRMKRRAKFATVSGQCNNSNNPEALYRKCGFVGNDIWHILSER